MQLQMLSRVVVVCGECNNRRERRLLWIAFQFSTMNERAAVTIRKSMENGDALFPLSISGFMEVAEVGKHRQRITHICS